MLSSADYLQFGLIVFLALLSAGSFYYSSQNTSLRRYKSVNDDLVETLLKRVNEAVHLAEEESRKLKRARGELDRLWQCVSQTNALLRQHGLEPVCSEDDEPSINAVDTLNNNALAGWVYDFLTRDDMMHMQFKLWGRSDVLPEAVGKRRLATLLVETAVNDNMRAKLIEGLKELRPFREVIGEE